MAYIFENPNPNGQFVGDCVIRALSIALNQTWDEVYLELSTYGFLLRDMPSSNRVWSEFLREQGFKSNVITNTCPYCYTVKDFCRDYPQGVYVLATGTHVVTVIDGNYHDAWDSGDEVPIYYFTKEE